MNIQVIVLSLAIGIALVWARCEKVKRGDPCQTNDNCTHVPLQCNQWRDGCKVCQPVECGKAGERCGWYKGRCCTDEEVYCYKAANEKSRCTPLADIPESDHSQVLQDNV
ncbi:hypothetical protein TCAL_07141 [Tigriopus californicus]|uniref:Granulins domain-containing protein n=2 Tax=Tigriopus californicus TaxID=6832 RepID=A0A553NE66_TIGCA|nr:hypothetical protein TCAL_07141 [Tigriopus californicus]|eukprot:TCALIF_07141-PA protein Name:"Protein of unknown function" AED:0.01 eAED:0.01 QI:25/1/0.5/1/1/1/2/0/109